MVLLHLLNEGIHFSGICSERECKLVIRSNACGDFHLEVYLTEALFSCVFVFIYFWVHVDSDSAERAVQHAVIQIYRSMFNYRTKWLSTDLMTLQKLPSETDRL